MFLQFVYSCLTELLEIELFIQFIYYYLELQIL